MQELIFYNGSASLDVKLLGKKVYSSFLSFICLFAHAIVRAYRVRLFKKKKTKKQKNKKQKKKKNKKKKHHVQVQWKSERVPDKTVLPSFFFFCCKDPAQTVWVHMHMMIWNFVGHIFSWTPSYYHRKICKLLS